MTDKNEIIEAMALVIKNVIASQLDATQDEDGDFTCDGGMLNLTDISEKQLEALAQHVPNLDKLISGEYVAVPKEPTIEMLDAGQDDMDCYGEEYVKAVYKAMIKAAQTEVEE